MKYAAPIILAVGLSLLAAAPWLPGCDFPIAMKVALDGFGLLMVGCFAVAL